MISTDYRIYQAIKEINETYGDLVSVYDKAKSLRKWGENEAVSTALTVIMTLPAGVAAETMLSTNGITKAVSSNDTDTQTIYYEGHTISGGNLTFTVPQTFNLTGQTPVTLPTALARSTRAKLLSGTVTAGNISFYEGGAVTAGVPNDANTVHLILPTGESQTQKASTSVSSSDYWLIEHLTASVLEKTSSWAQVRIEAKNCLSTVWLPQTQYFGVSDSQGTVEIDLDPFVIIPKNFDVRLVAKANTTAIHVAGGMSGYLAIIT